MGLYEFELKCALPTLDADLDVCAHALYAGGCDDALIGTGQAGKVAVRFCRKADSALAAIMSGICDLRRCLPEVQLIESNPDLVGLSDIAMFLGCTRQNVRKLMINSYTEFPQPFHDGKTQIWRLAEVLGWLRCSGKNMTVDDGLVEVAQVNMQVNFVLKDIPCLDAKVRNDLRRLTGNIA